MCFSISDSNWPSVHHSSREFTAQASRMTYEVHCDPLDQFTSFPDDTNDCEDTGSTMPGQTSHRCPRLGGLKNPCFENELQWELMVCDESDGNADNHWCESLAGKREVLENRFVKDGVTYDNEAIKPVSSTSLSTTIATTRTPSCAPTRPSTTQNSLPRICIMVTVRRRSSPTFVRQGDRTPPVARTLERLCTTSTPVLHRG